MSATYVPMNLADIERDYPMTAKDGFPRELPKSESELLTESLRFDPAANSELPTGMPTDTILEQAAGPANSALPTISGTTTVEETLTVTNGTWTGSPLGYSYDWQTSATGTGDWSSIEDGNGLSTYTIAEADENQYLRCVVTATSATGSASAASAATAQIAGAS